MVGGKSWDFDHDTQRAFQGETISTIFYISSLNRLIFACLDCNVGEENVKSYRKSILMYLCTMNIQI